MLVFTSGKSTSEVLGKDLHHNSNDSYGDIERYEGQSSNEIKVVNLMRFCKQIVLQRDEAYVEKR